MRNLKKMFSSRAFDKAEQKKKNSRHQHVDYWLAPKFPGVLYYSQRVESVQLKNKGLAHALLTYRIDVEHAQGGYRECN